jgi:hypothetical protein
VWAIFGDTISSVAACIITRIAFLMQLLNYLKQLLNRDLNTQEPCPKRIAADAGEIVAEQSE